MRLRRQLMISMIVFGIVLLIIASSAFFTNLQVAQLSDQQDIVEAIQNEAGRLNQISTDYFLKQQDAQLTQFLEEFNYVLNDVSSVRPANWEQQALLDKIYSDIQLLNPAFNHVVTFLQNAPRNQSVRAMPEFQAIWAGLSQQNTALSSDSAHLLQAIGNQSDQLKTENSIIIVALVCAVGGYFVANYFVVYRRALTSISKLQTGTRIVGSGNLDFSIETSSEDEVGELSVAFNQMTSNLKTLTTNKAQLEEEVKERRKLEERLEGSKLQLEKERNLLQAIIDEPKNMHLVYLDRNFNFLRVNEAYARTCGYKPAEMIGKNHFALYPSDENEAIFAEVRDKGETVCFHDKPFVFPDQPKRGITYWDWTLSAIKDASGNIGGLVFALVETTERKRLEESLRRAQAELSAHATDLERLVEERTKQLRDSERLAAIGQTAGMVGHDIRNPLQAISGDVYLLKSDLASLPESERQESIKESLAGIEENVEYVNKIVQDLQDFARPLSPVATEVDVHKVLCEDALFKNGIPKNIGASCRVENEAEKLVTDREMLRRILCNLVTNAVQAMPDGGKLDVYAYQEAGDIVFVVQDTGIGIPEETKPKLFTPLFTTKSKGQGFGLAVVKRLTEALDGTVTFESEIGKGTKFIVHLPKKH